MANGFGHLVDDIGCALDVHLIGYAKQIVACYVVPLVVDVKKA